jgi:hypothetical protein
MKGTCVLVLGAGLFLTACNADPTGGAQAPHLVATVRGAVEADYEGTSGFHISRDRRTGVPTFVLSSTRTVQTFRFVRRSGGLPKKGTYPIVLSELSGGDATGITVTYDARTGNAELTEAFVAQSGELRIEESSPQMVRGSFRFTAFLYCRIPSGPVPPEGACAVPTTPIQGAPTIEVAGSFLAFPANDVAHPL